MAPRLVAVVLTIVTSPVPVELTAPVNWLPALFSVTVPAPAATVVVPATVAAPPCDTVPPLVVTDKLPPTVRAPRVIASWAIAVKLPPVPVLTVPALVSIVLALVAGVVRVLSMPACKTTCSVLPVPALMAGITVPPLTQVAKVMLPCACKVRVAVPPATEVVVSYTVILPGLPLAPVSTVRTVTDVPLVSAADKVPTSRNELPLPLSKPDPFTIASGVSPCAAVSSMVRLSGSSNQLPPFPLGAPRSTRPVRMLRLFLPEVSTCPPSPPFAPPRAVMEPLNEVWLSAHTATSPPLPLSVALALMLACGPTTVRLAFCTSPTPCMPPPMCTVPPPAVPEASMDALSNRPTRSPSTLTVPPVCPAPSPLASMEPVTTVSPPIARRVTMPLCSLTELARITPVWLTAVASAPSCTLAIIDTMPPLAWIVPALAALACRAAASTE